MTRPARDVTPVYAWITGQDFNIGDSLLRRPYVEALSTVGPVDIWVREASNEFMTGLGHHHHNVSRSFRSWYLRALRSAISRPTVIALNAGEIWVSWRRAAMLSLLAALGLVARLRGGDAVWLGASVRPTQSRALSAIYRTVVRTMSTVSWREPGSIRAAIPRQVVPDWAFSTGTEATEWQATVREGAAFILRGDRPMPGPAWIDWARQSTRALSLEPVFIVQVRTDSDRARELQSQLGGTVVEWPGNVGHRDHEERVREAYRACRVAIGDRLHGLVMAATEGAVPVGWVETSSGKIAAHFAPADMGYVGAFEGESFAGAPVLDEEMVTRWSQSLPADIGRARDLLAGLRSRLHAR